MLKDSDPHFSTLPEINLAFGVFRDFIYEMCPSHRGEFDTYQANISNLAMTWGGRQFSGYHKSFSAKAAMHIQRFDQRHDWSIVDLALISRQFLGHQALWCSVCNSFSHSTHLCHKSVSMCMSWDEFALRKRNETKIHQPHANVPELEEALKKHPDHCFVYNYLIKELVQTFLVS